MPEPFGSGSVADAAISPGPRDAVGLASAAPVQTIGTRTRAGNAMGRTRAGILEATGVAVEKHGLRRLTMNDVATTAGVAKGTLYNHFRTREDVLTAALAAGIEALAEECLVLSSGAGEQGLARALRLAAETLAAHPALVRLATEERSELVVLLLPGPHGAWPAARAALARAVLASQLPGQLPAGSAPDDGAGEPPSDDQVQLTAAAAAVETVLRWMVTFVGSPGVPGETAAGAALLARTLCDSVG